MTVLSTEETIVVTGLHPGVEYVFTVVAENDIGESVPSDPERATTLEEGETGIPKEHSDVILCMYFVLTQYQVIPHKM